MTISRARVHQEYTKSTPRVHQEYTNQREAFFKFPHQMPW